MSSNIDKSIASLFKARDKAIETRDRKLFLSAYVGDLLHSSYEGCIKIDKVKTVLFYVYSEKDAPFNKVVFGREAYYPKDEDSYSTFVVFYLVETREGWKIYRVAY